MAGHSTDGEILEIVDEDDRVIGRATRAEIHEKGLMHRAVHIFVFNPGGEIYIQRRSATKDKHPLVLDSSAAGHVDPGESYRDTAVRELEEELGISESLEEVLRVKACPETDNEHVVLYAAHTEKEPVPDPEEIQWGGFMPVGELTEKMRSAPEDFVPAFILLWKRFMEMRGRGIGAVTPRDLGGAAEEEEKTHESGCAKSDQGEGLSRRQGDGRDRRRAADLAGRGAG